MSQVQVRANLLASDFVFVSKFQGRTILTPQSDQVAAKHQNSQISGSDNDSQPECYYMHNVMPTTQGYKSVAYREVVSPPTIPQSFARIIEFRDSDAPPEQDRGYLGITANGKTFMISTLNGDWRDVTPANQPITEVTVATVKGISYVCYKNFGIFTINMHTFALSPVTLLGVTASLIHGISASNNYLLLHDGALIYWSSAIDPLDHVPSLITGAGSGTPASTGGPIVAIYPLSTGFAIYTTTNIILSSYSGNTRYPWVFKECNNSSGLNKVTEVAINGDGGTNYAWTSGGLLKLSLAGAEPALPDVTDFLAGGIIEYFDPVTKTLSQKYLTNRLNIQVSFIGTRYLVISYGESDFSHAIVYDIALKRIGKLKINHVSAISFTMDSAGGNPSYMSEPGLTYLNGAGDNYSQPHFLSAIPAVAKHTIAFLQGNGAIQLAIMDFGDFSADAVLLMGKYQMFRNHAISIHGITVETIDTAINSFKCSLISTLDGLTYQAAQEIAQQAGNSDVRQYNCRSTAVNHSILFEGSFNMVSLLLALSKHGRV
jgi:hypothetical protein